MPANVSSKMRIAMPHDAQEGRNTIARKLVDAGADVAQTYCGYRAYDAAKRNNNTAIVKMIIDETAKKSKVSTKAKQSIGALGF